MPACVGRVADVVSEPLRLAAARADPVAPAELVVVLPDPHGRVTHERNTRFPRRLDRAVAKCLANAAGQKKGDQIGERQSQADPHEPFP